MTTVRWVFRDTATGETATVPVNPNKMDTPTPARTVKSSTGPDGLVRLFDTGAERPTSWSFGGVILTQAHYDLLLAWSQRDPVLEITDHLGRTFTVLIESYAPVDRRPTPGRPWRATYTITCQLLKGAT